MNQKLINYLQLISCLYYIPAFCLNAPKDAFEILRTTHTMNAKAAQETIRILLKYDGLKADELYIDGPNNEEPITISPVYYAALTALKTNKLVPFETLLAESDPDKPGVSKGKKSKTLYEYALLNLKKSTYSKKTTEKMLKLVLKRKQKLGHNYCPIISGAFELPKEDCLELINDLLGAGLNPDTIYPESNERLQGLAPIAYTAGLAVLKGNLNAFKALLQKSDPRNFVAHQSQKRTLVNFVYALEKTVTDDFIENLFTTDNFDCEQIERAEKLKELTMKRCVDIDTADDKTLSTLDENEFKQACQNAGLSILRYKLALHNKQITDDNITQADFE